MLEARSAHGNASDPADPRLMWRDLGRITNEAVTIRKVPEQNAGNMSAANQRGCAALIESADA